MKIGAMTNPQRDLLDEIRQIAAEGFDYADITLEAPRAEPGQIDAPAVRRLLDELGIGVVCHAAPYLPVHNPSALVRRAALDELRRSLDVAASLGARLLTTHYMGFPAFWPEATGYDLYTQLYRLLCAEAAQRGMLVAMENSPRNAHQLKHFREIFARCPDLYLLLDVGHANIDVPKNQTREYLFSLADRLAHVHLSDNDGAADQHLPLGAPAKKGVSWRRVAADLKSFGYDGTVTLEVFAGDRSYRQDSARRWRAWWGGTDASSD
ncbi:MAG: sugar phosphate isomerase/epimerase family protein [Anaerolineae bacterium]